MIELFPQPVTPNNATLYTRLRMMLVEGHHFDAVLTLVQPWCTCVRKALRNKVLSKRDSSNEPGIDEWQSLTETIQRQLLVKWSRLRET